MYSRVNSPALRRATGRALVRGIHWRAIRVPATWFDAHRASRIEARVAEARDRAFVRQYEVGRRCGF